MKTPVTLTLFAVIFSIAVGLIQYYGYFKVKFDAKNAEIETLQERIEFLQRPPITGGSDNIGLGVAALGVDPQPGTGLNNTSGDPLATGRWENVKKEKKK